MTHAVQDHYNIFLAGNYTWMCGGWEEQIRINRHFFSSHTVMPRDNGVAIDLGAGNGFQSVPLAMLGYSVTAVDFCQPLLDALRTNAGDLPIVTVNSDILQYSSWSGRNPALIVCMGDTLTHLPDLPSVTSLIRHCHTELEPGGTLVLSLRDYSSVPAGTTECIPVCRNDNRIFLCSLKYHEKNVMVEDILYSRDGGSWRRHAGRYSKIRIHPDHLARIVRTAGFTLHFSEFRDSKITIIAVKENTVTSGPDLKTRGI
jgi:predicted RNA methylase